MDLVDSDSRNHEIEIEYEIYREHGETQVDLRVVGDVPPSLGLSRSAILHYAEDLFWQRDLITELGDDDQVYFEE